MTDLNTAKEAIYLRFDTLWAAAAAFTFENDEFDEPANAPWARVSIRNDVRVQDTMGATGNRRMRSTGRVLVQVYTRTDTGVKQGDTLAKQAADIFDAVSFSGLDFQAAVVRESGVQGKWFQHIAEAEFDYDEIK